ncbi:hypothetical protein LP43_1151 [Methylophaga thiooxydans]|uniref:Uncharacterized protein n=1 Tax=Methylophaga thiooxydans TaxID=392484 RepID=A0A0A0BG75_9GAMM|nr:hypothetical protein [Methylophaga thiooxydans]KGM07538.1 hypothetical protein LP43_1151 [Methylophaga thiooxydans]
MNDWLYLLLIPLFLLAIWFWPEQKSRSAMRRSQDAIDDETGPNRYHAVTIQPCSHACDAVIQLGSKRFLANEVTSLPVAGCDASRCQCTYKHYADRRIGEDRRHTRIAQEHIYARHEHRKGEDRRQQHVFQ